MTPDEELAALRRLAELQGSPEKPSTLVDSLKSGVSGLAEGAVKLPFAAADLLKLGVVKGGNMLAGEGWQEKNKDWLDLGNLGSSGLDKLIETILPGGVWHKPGTETGKYVNAGAMGLGGALGGLGVAGLANKGAGALATTKAALPGVSVAGVTSGLGAHEAQKRFPDYPMLSSFLGGLAGGVAPAAAALIPKLAGKTGPLNTLAGTTDNADRMLHTIGSGAGPSDFPQARINLDTLNSAGARTTTMGDLFPANSTVGAGVDFIAGSAGGGALQRRLAGREDDISALIADALSATGQGRNSPATVSDMVANAAQSRIDQLRRVKNRPLERLRNLPPVPAHEVMTGIRNLERAGTSPGMFPEADRSAILGIVEALTDANTGMVRPRPGPYGTTVTGLGPGPQQSLPAIGLNIADFSQKPVAYGASAGQQINARSAGIAQNLASDAVNNFPAPWGPSYQGARNTSDYLRNRFYEPAISGPLGKLAGHPGAVAEVPASRLSSIVANRNPDEITALVKQLGKGDRGIGTDSTSQIARAILDQRAQTGHGGDVTRLRGEKGAPLDQNLQALIEATGGNTQRFNQKLDAAEVLKTGGQRSPDLSVALAKESERSLLGAIAQPFYTARRLAAEGASQEAVAKVAEILANPTPDTLRRLEQAAAVDPSLKLALVRTGIISGIAASSGVGP